MRIDSLTFLRFAAAFIVLVFHYGAATDLAVSFSPFIVAGPPMVTFFFTLSGFVMLVSHYKKHNQSLRIFYVARAARILPIYLVALFFTASLVYGYGINDIYSLFLSTIMMQAWISPYPVAMNTPGWSLSVEVFFYLNFPLILYVIRKYEPRSSSLVLFSLALYLVTQIALSYLMRPPFFQGYPSFSHDLVYYFPLSHLCSFIMGITGGLLYLRNPGHFGKTGIRSYIVLIAGFYLTYYLLQNPHILQNLIEAPLAYGSSFYTWLALILILCVAYASNGATRFLASRPMVFLGDISLSVYILQKPVHLVYEEHIAPVLGLGDNGNFYAFCAILIGISCITFLVIEKRGSKMIFYINKWLSSRWPAKTKNNEVELSGQ